MKKVIFLWVHPRSLSTAFERAIIQRDDLHIFHEPFAYLYYIKEAKGDIPNFHVDPNHPITYSEIKKMILDKFNDVDNTKSIFVKDMGFHCLKHFLKDEEFISNPNIIHSFLIRDPIKAVASHFKMYPKVTPEEIGHEALYQMYQKIVKLTNKRPIIIDADSLQSDPQGTMQKYCLAVQLPYKSNSLKWNEGMLPIWNTWKEWHIDAAESSGFKPPEDNSKHLKIIEENPHLWKHVNYVQPYYDQLKELQI